MIPHSFADILGYLFVFGLLVPTWLIMLLIPVKLTIHLWRNRHELKWERGDSTSSTD